MCIDWSIKIFTGFSLLIFKMLNTNYYYYAVKIYRVVIPKESIVFDMINICTLLHPLFMKPSIIIITEKSRWFIKNSLNLIGLERQNYTVFWWEEHSQIPLHCPLNRVNLLRGICTNFQINEYKSLIIVVFSCSALCILSTFHLLSCISKRTYIIYPNTDRYGV